MKKTIIATLLILAMAFTAQAATYDLILQWDSNTESDLATGDNPRYKVYKGKASFNGIKPILPKAGVEVFNVKVADDEDATNELVQFTVQAISDQEVHYFTVTALDESGNESGLSNEVSTLIVDHDAPAAPKGLKYWWEKLVAWWNQLTGGLRIG